MFPKALFIGTVNVKSNLEPRSHSVLRLAVGDLGSRLCENRRLVSKACGLTFLDSLILVSGSRTRI